MKSSDNKASLLDFISQTICAKNDILIPKDISLALGGTFSGNDKTVRLVKIVLVKLKISDVKNMKRQILI